MKMNEFQIRPWMGLLGFMGFAGFFYFSTGDAPLLGLFGSFSFFSLYWWGKLQGEIEDERLKENQSRANQMALQVSLMLNFLGMTFIGIIIGWKDPGRAYALLNATVALSYAVALNLAAFLTYRYDQKD